MKTKKETLKDKIFHTNKVVTNVLKVEDIKTFLKELVDALKKQENSSRYVDGWMIRISEGRLDKLIEEHSGWKMSDLGEKEK